MDMDLHSILLEAIKLLPLITTTTVVVLLKYPQLLNRLNISEETFHTILKANILLYALRHTNRALNSWALNNWRVSAHDGWDWPAEVAVVTGGSGGIGLAIAKGLAQRGVKVAILDLQPPPPSPIGGEEEEEEGQGKGVISYYQCDVTSPESVASAAEALRRELGPPSILVNNAGLSQTETILEVPYELVRRVFEVNALAHWITARQFVPHMVAQDRGHVVTVSSMGAYMSLATSAHYSASKAAAQSFHETLGNELRVFYGAPGVLTTAVSTNFVRTAMIDYLRGPMEKGLGKILEVEEVANPIVDQIFRRRGGALFIPGDRALLTGVRGWPNWIQEALRDRVGKFCVKVHTTLVKVPKRDSAE